LPTSSVAEPWSTIVADAAEESSLWSSCVRGDREEVPVFSPLAELRFALGLETIYEGYLLHYGRPRLFAPPDADTALLLGDYLYAHGLVRVAEVDPLDAVADLAELISLCAQVQAERRRGDGALWAATAALLGRDGLGPARTALRMRADAEPLEALARAAVGAEAVDRALAEHASRFN
jgi:hypothetical protein